jgi:hypothetical protein
VTQSGHEWPLSHDSIDLHCQIELEHMFITFLLVERFAIVQRLTCNSTQEGSGDIPFIILELVEWSGKIPLGHVIMTLRTHSEANMR